MDHLRCLRVFAQVIADGSFAKAARTMDLAPAVVTRSIADLEEHLGARLVNRSTRSLALTEIGEAYLESAQRVLAELDGADALAGASTAEPSGVLRVLCPPAFAIHQLAHHLPRFRTLYPRIMFEIATPGPVAAADDSFDVSILSIGHQPLQGEFIARTLATSTFILCAASSYLDQHGHPQTPDALLQHASLVPDVSAVRRNLTLYRQTPNKTEGATNTVSLVMPTPTLSTNHIDLLYAAALAGLGIAGLPSFIAQRALQDGRLQRVLPAWRGASLTLYAAMPTRKHVPARTRLFLDFLVQSFGGGDTDPWLGLD